MIIVDLIIIALAANAIATAWFYGSLFEGLREPIEQRGGFFGELFGCPMCLSYHIAFWTAALLWLPGLFLDEPWQQIVRLPLYALAVTTLVHYMQGVLPIKEDDDESGTSTGTSDPAKDGIP